MNEKLDRKIGGTSVKYVTETYDDGSNWYRKWSDGWLEQGGVLDHPLSDDYFTVTFLVPFADARYIALKNYGLNEASNSIQLRYMVFYNLTPTSMQSRAAKNVTEHRWYACGHAA